MRAVQADAKNLSFQLSDIATGLSTGQSPFMIMNQQLGQVTQILGGRGLMGALALVRTSLAASWPMLALLGVSALASAAYEYFNTSEKESKEATKELEAHAKAIQELADQYGHLFPELERVAKTQTAAAEAAKKNEAFIIAQAAAYEKTRDVLQGMPADLGEIETMLTALGASTEDIVRLQEEFGKLDKSVDEYKATSADAKTVVAALDKIIASNEGAVKTLATAIREQLVGAMKELDRAAASATESLRSFGETGRTMPLVGADVILGTEQRRFRNTLAEGGAGPTATVEFLKTRAASQEIADSLERLDEDMARALAKLFLVLPDTAKITSGVRTYAEQARLRADFEAGRGGLAARPGTSRHEIGAAVDIGQGVSMEELREAVKLVPELEQLKGRAYEVDKVHVQLRGTAAKQEKAAAEQAVQNEEQRARAAERQLKQQGEALEQLNAMITTEQREIALKEKINAINADGTLKENERALAIATVTAEAAKEAEVERLVNQAKEAGLAITPALIAQYQALAQAKVNAIVTDQQLAIAQREAAKATQEQQQAIQQFNQQMQQMAVGAISGLVQDLRNGVEAGEAFNNMLNRIIDSLIQMAIQMAVSSIFKGFGGFGVGGALMGGRVGTTAFPQRRVDPSVFIGAPRMAGGGIVGDEVPIIAHRGELIVPKSMVGRGSNTITNNLGTVNIDMSATGMVASGNEQAKQFGINVQKLIQLEMVRESRPGGLLRRVPG